jgi:hypothetical protein
LLGLRSLWCGALGTIVALMAKAKSTLRGQTNII